MTSQRATGTRGRVRFGRRAFLGGATTATAVLVAGAAYADDSPPEVGRFIRGSIRATTRDDRTVSVAIRDAVHQVDDVRQVIAKDFPASWEFRSGDWVGVDLDALQVFPYLLAPVVNSAGQLVHIMPNDDHKRDRTILRAERTVDGE